MALPLSNTFDGGSNGTAISAANSGGTSGDAWNTITGTAPVFSTDHAKDGTLSGKWVIPSGTKTSSLRWTGFGSLTTDVWGRAYLWISAAPTTEFRLIAARNNSGSGSAFIDITTAGVLRILNAAQTTVATGTVTIATGQWVRVEWRVRSATTNGQVEVWLFNNPDSTTADDHFSTTTAVLAANTDQMEHGVCTNAGQAAYTFYLDGIAASSTAALGPEAGATVNGDAAITLASPATSAAGAVLVQGAGSGAIAPAASGAGAVLVQGASSAALTNPAASAAGAVLVQGSSSTTLAGPSASGAGTVSSSGVNGAAAITLSGPTATATGAVLIQGAASITLAIPVVSGSATHPVQGASAAQLGAASTAGTGTVFVQGAGSASFTPVVGSSGTVLVQGAGLGHLAATATGTGTIGSFISGDAALALSSPIAAGAGAVPVQGSGSVTLALTTHGDGSLPGRVIVTGPFYSKTLGTWW